MYTKCRNFLFFILILLIVGKCRTKTRADKSAVQVSISPAKTPFVEKFDSIVERLSTHSELVKNELLEMNVFDTITAARLSETGYPDTTVQLNDSILYSIIGVGDEAGVCTYFYVVTVDKKNRKFISSVDLHPDCDIDYSWARYELYEHSIVSRDRILLAKTIVFQTKERKSDDEDENIDHKEQINSFFVISPTGQIGQTKS